MYVPQGTTVGSINVTTSASATGMYEPNQFVMNCGIADPTAGPIRFSSPVARNLNDGDAITGRQAHQLSSKNCYGNVSLCYHPQ